MVLLCFFELLTFGEVAGPVAKRLQLRLDEQQLPLNAFHRGLIAVSHGLKRRDGHIAQVGLRGVLLLPFLIRDSLLLALARQLLRRPVGQDAIEQEAEQGNQGRAIAAPESGCDLCQCHGFAVSWPVFGSVPAYGEGSQCATMTASGAKIAAALAWVAQNAAMAGVAVFAMAVSSSTTVGR